MDSPSTTFVYKTVLNMMAVGVFINMLLNFYWAYLIVNQVYRILTRGASKVETSFVPAHENHPAQIELK